MKTSSLETRPLRVTCLLALLAAVLLVLVPDAAQAKKKEKKVALEKYRARAVSLDRGRIRNLDIAIYEWTTPEERESLFDAFAEGGSKKLYGALFKLDGKGSVKLPNTLAYDMKYAFQFEDEDKRRIVLATDRPLGFIEFARASRSLDYNVSLVVLELDKETGEGEGIAMGGAELSVDKKTGRIIIEHTGTQPTKLTLVKKLGAKKKKKTKSE